MRAADDQMTPDDDDANLRAELESVSAELVLERQNNRHLRAWIDKLEMTIARMNRARFGRSSERVDSDQLELLVAEVREAISRVDAKPELVDTPVTSPTVRKALPEHLPREIVHHLPACECPQCGGAMQRIGEDVAEMLEYVPARFKVIRHVRPKLSCVSCRTIAQMPAPSRPIDRGLPGPGLLAHVAVSKFADALPLYRQSQIYAREGVSIERSTLADWLGATTRLTQPLVDALRRYVFDASKLHGDDTPVPVLEPGRKRTKEGRLWTYVRDDHASGSSEPAAVWFGYSPDRKGEHPARHLREFRGTLQADGYSGFAKLYKDDAIQEAACWAHVRRHFYDFYEHTASPIAAEAIRQIKELYKIERQIRGRSALRRRRVRKARAGPLLKDLHEWLQATLTTVSRKSELGKAILYALTRWKALTRYCDDGLLEIDNNTAERALRGVAVGRKNWLFAGSDAGGQRAAAFYSLIGTAKMNGHDPQAYLRHVLERIAEHPINRIEELLPWNVDVEAHRAALQAA